MTVTEWLGSPFLLRLAMRIAYTRGLPAEDAQDLFQELRLALLKAQPDRLINATFVLHTARNKAVDLLKTRVRMGRVNASPIGISSPLTGEDPDLVHLLRARAAQLPEQLHEFYRLRYEEGLSQREVAKRVGLCRSSIRCLERRCLRMMKGRLG